MEGACKSKRTVNRLKRSNQQYSVSNYLDSLPDVRSDSSDEAEAYDDESMMEFSIDDDQLPENFENQDSEFENDFDHSTVTKINPSKSDYMEAFLSSIMSNCGLNLPQAESVVNLVNHVNRRFSNDPVIFPSVRYLWDKKSKANPVECYIICEKNHAHGPFKGEPKDFGIFVCDNIEFPAKLKNEKYFLYINFKVQLENHLTSITLDDMREDESNFIDDVSTANQAMKIKEKDSNLEVRKFTLSIRADEVQSGNSSSTKLFPVFLSINEMSPKIRRQHFFLVSLFVGKTKPNVSCFLGPITEELEHLEKDPISWTDKSGKNLMATFHLICLVADAPMRAYLRSVRQYNHLNGCDWCLVTASSENRARVYQNLPRESLRHLSRQHQDFLDFKESNTLVTDDPVNPRFKGIVGSSPLLKLDSFDMVKGISVEPMHCLVLVIFRSLVLKGWLGINQLDLFDRLVDRNLLKDQLSDRLSNIFVPGDFGRPPRGLDQILFWKSAEYDAFLTVYFFPIVKGLLKPKAINHILCLVRIYYLAHRGIVNTAKIDEITNLIEEFQSGVSAIYGKKFQTYNLHILSHLPDSLKELGPNANVSSYPLENYMGILKEKVTRTSNIAPSLVRVFINDFKYNETLTTQITNWKLSLDEKKAFGLLRNGGDEKKIICIKEDGYLEKVNTWRNLVRIEVDRNLENEQIMFLKSVSIDGIRYSTINYVKGKKRDDSFIKTHGNFFRIETIVRINNQSIFLICEKITTKPLKVNFKGFTGTFVIDFHHIHEIKDSKKSILGYQLFDINSQIKKSVYIPSTKLSGKYSCDHLVDPFLINK